MATKEEILSTFDGEEGAWWAYKDGIQTGYNEAFNSLRNQAAIAAMQTLVGRFNVNTMDSKDRKTIARMAVEQADALIEELKK